ncbi:hypothetical protein [Methylobacterium sp. Leaf91]|uniref:hypothetical protein n=1 Tax=Methylobacterium sp. Leaf91 TaxID=1736247 RepID=UPI0006FD0255|nr:hypothetical protein [Methylobacterium sp. Leaf91]KQO87331.1 hypothetical protein ASF32_23995 [Methylobacterium sp. Leaf91]
MLKKPVHFAYLIAVRQADETDRVYAILAKAVEEAIQLAAEHEPTGPAPRQVGLLGAPVAKRMELKVGEARVV